MGCGAAKATQTTEGTQSNSDKTKPTTPPDSNDQRKTSERPSTPVPKPVAFEIPIDPVVTDQGDEESLVKKHPPKRLARLEEQRISIPTVKDLEEKLQKAEERRQEILEEKISKSRAFTQKMQGDKGSQKSATSEDVNGNKIEDLPPSIPDQVDA